MNKNISKFNFGWFVWFSLFVIVACSDMTKIDGDVYNPEMIFPSDTLISIISSPAGSNVAYNYDPETNKLSASGDTLAFLPYPANIGFIHQNISSDENQVYSEIPCIVIGRQLPSMTPVGVRTIGAIEVLYQPDDIKTYVVCVPNDPQMVMTKISNFADLITTHDALKFQIQHFLLNYKGLNQTKILGWHDEKFADRIIQKPTSNK